MFAVVVRQKHFWNEIQKYLIRQWLSGLRKSETKWRSSLFEKRKLQNQWIIVLVGN